MPPTVSIPPTLERSKQSSERMERPGYQDLLSKCVHDGLSERGTSKSSSTLQGKGDPRFLENSTSGSRQDTSGAAEGPLAEHNSGHRGLLPPSVPTPKSFGTGIMRGRALRTEDFKTHVFPRSLLKSRGMDTKARTGVQSPMFSFRSLLEGAISASGVQPPTSVHKLAESGMQGALSLSRDNSVPHVSYSSLVQAQLGDDPVQRRTNPSCKTAGALRLNVEAHSPPVKFQLQSAEGEGEFLALLNQTTRSLAPVARRPSSWRTDSVSVCGRMSDVHSSEKLLQAVAGDAPRSAGIVSERDGRESLRATAVPASAVLASSEDDVPGAERRSSVVADSMCSDEDALGAPLPEEGDGPLAVNESLFAERVAIDFSETGAIPASPVLTRIREDVSVADVGVVRASFVVADSTSFEDEMMDAQLLEALERGLAIDESRFTENALAMGGIDSPEAAADLTSPVPTKTEQGVAGEEVVVADSVSTDEKALDVQLSGELCGTLGVDESRSAHDVPKRDVTDSSEASAVPEVPMFTRLEEADLPAEVQRANCVVIDSISGEENASDVQPPEEVLQELALDETRSAEIVDSSGGGAVPASPVLVRREEDVPRVEVMVAGLMGNDEEMSDAFVSDQPSQAFALDELRSTDTVIEGGAGNLSEAAAGPASLVSIRTGEDAPLAEASVGKEVGLCGHAMVHSEQGKGHLLSFNRSDGQVLDERIQSPAQHLETEKRCADGRDGLIDAGTTLVSSCQAGLKQSSDADADFVDAETILERSCKAGLKKMDGANGVGEDSLCEVQRDFVLYSLFETDETFPSGCESDLSAAGTVSDSSRQAVPKQTENQSASFVEESKDEMCDAYMPSPTENVPLKSKADIDLASSVLEKELDISKGDPVDSVHTEVVKRAEESVVDPVSVVVAHSVSTDEGMPDTELFEELTGALGGSVSLCAEGRSELVAEGAVVRSSWQADPKHVEPRKVIIGREQEDNICHIEILEDFMGAMEEHLMGSDCESGPQTSCVGSVEMTSTTASPHANGNLLVAERDGGDQMVSLTEEKVEEEHILGGLEGSNEVVNPPEVEQLKVDNFADGVSEMQRVIIDYSEGFVASGTGYESEKLSSSELLVVEPGIRNDVEKVPEGYVGEIVHVSTDSGNSGVPANQALSTDPDGALSEGLKPVFLRDSDGTFSGSLESVQVGVAQEAGKEVQSPLVSKSKDRHCRHVDDLEDRHTSHLDELKDNGEQPLNGTVHDRLVGAEVRPLKKRGRPRAYNHEAERPHLHPFGSAVKRRLQINTSNRCRRNRHINPDQPVPIFVEGRDEGFEDADAGAFCRWLAHQAAPSPAVRKKVGKHDQEFVKSIIATPSFRVVAEYEDRQQKVEKRRKVVMQQHPGTCETLMSSSTVRASNYDMDDADETWLHAWNERLARGGLKQPISEDKFEEMIEYFERMYAQMEVAPAGDFPGFPDGQKSLAHSVPGSFLPSSSPSGLGCLSTNPATSDTVTEKPSEGSLQKSFKPLAEQQPSDDCCICNGGEDDETNPVYTCKRCLIHVHQSCYGIREKFRDDEGQVVAPSSWCCRKCEAVAVGSAQPKVSCALCRKRGGALKPTVAPRKWAHVACALYIKETFFVDSDAMEPIDGIAAAVAARARDRQDRCGLCGVKRGICSLCSVKGCRAPFHISCGVSQGASFKLRQFKQKVVGVRSFCPRHAPTTSVDSAPSAGLKEGHMVSSSTTSGATASAIASGSISTASSMDYREGGFSRLSISHPHGSFVEPANVAALTDNVMSLNGKGVEDPARERPKAIRFTLKRSWNESCTQESDDGLLSDVQRKFGNGRGVTGDKIEAPGCKSTWHVVEPGQKLKKLKFKFGKLAQNQDPESSPTLVQQERIGSEHPEAEKIEEIMPAVGEASGDAAVNDWDTVFVSCLSEDRFAKEVKELMILGEAMKSGVAPVHIMREAFVYWRAKRAEYKGSLLCELHHKHWSKSQGIFKIPGDPRDVKNVAAGKVGSSMRVPLARQPSPVSTEKMLEKAEELREQLDRVRSMAQMVVQREKLKRNQQRVLMTIASAELNRVESIISLGDSQRCVWCPSTKTLLKCGTCPRSFCFNCFKNRKGFGVKGWMAASKQVMYSCKYCRELSSNNIAELSKNLDPAREEIGDAGLVSNPVVPSEPVDGMVSTQVITCEPVRRGRGKGMGKGRDEGWGLQRLGNPDPASLPLVGCGMIAPPKGLGIGRGKGNGWTVNENAGLGSSRHGSENGANNQSKLSELEIGLNKFLSITNDQMEHSCFETTLRRLKILRRKNKDANQELTMSLSEIPFGDIAEATADVRASKLDGLEAVKPSTTNGGNVAVPVSPASGPVLLVYKKNRRLILGSSSEVPLSAYDFADELKNYPLSSPTGLENGTSESPVGRDSGIGKGLKKL